MTFHYLFRFIIIGDSGVGKSCILQKFKNNTFNTNVPSTIGVEFIRKDVSIDNKTIKIQVWDTAGQENMQSMTRSYFKNSCAVLIVYDITSRSSFEHLNNWIKNVDDNVNPGVEKILIGNKTDLEKQREISKSEGEAFAKSLNMNFLETSAKDGNRIEELFHKTAHEVYLKVVQGKIKATSDGLFGVKYGEDYDGVIENEESYTLGEKKKKKSCC